MNICRVTIAMHKTRGFHATITNASATGYIVACYGTYANKDSPGTGLQEMRLRRLKSKLRPFVIKIHPSPNVSYNGQQHTECLSPQWPIPEGTHQRLEKQEVNAKRRSGMREKTHCCNDDARYLKIRNPGPFGESRNLMDKRVKQGYLPGLSWAEMQTP